MKNKLPLTNIELFTKKEYPLDTPTNDFEENHKEQFFAGMFIGSTSHYHCLNGVEEGIMIEWKDDPFDIVKGNEIVEYFIR